MTVNAINLGARMFHICISLYIYVHSVCVDTTSLSREFPYTRLKSAFLMGFHSRGFLGERENKLEPNTLHISVRDMQGL